MRIWFSRNKLIHDGKKLHIPSIVWQAKCAVQDAKMAFTPRAAWADLHWLPPPTGWNKMNTDATIDAQGGVGIASILRDADGRVLAAMMMKMTAQMDIFNAECLAVREGLRLLRGHSSHHLIIESDALTVVNATWAGASFRSVAGDHIMEICAYLTKFRTFQINHCYQECNMAAHHLAKHALTRDNIAIWIAYYLPTLTGLP